MASSEEDMPDLGSDTSGDSEDDEKPNGREKYPAHQPQAPFDSKASTQQNAADDDDDDLPELLDGGTDDEDDEDDDDEPPPLVGESDEDDDSEDEHPKGRGDTKSKPEGPTLPGLKPGFFPKPKPPPKPAAATPTPAAAPKPTPTEPAKPQPAPNPSPFIFNSASKPAGKEDPAPEAEAAPPPATKPPPRRADGEVEEASDGNDSDEVPDLLEAEDEDEESGSDVPESDAEQESDEEEDEPGRQPYGGQRAPRMGRSFYPEFESEERALQERRQREAERRRREEERAREKAERKKREAEERRRRNAEARKRQQEDAMVYANSAEARELAEQARLRAEAEMEEKRLQMGLGPREKTVNEGEEEIGPSYFCRGSHCPGNQRMLTKTQEYIEFRCTERCMLLYHTGDCHRKDVKSRMEREHGVWKEEEGAPCITPDCPGTLTKGTKWQRFGKVSYQIIDPEKYEKKRREKERQRAEEKAAKQAAKQAATTKRSKKHDRQEDEELEGNARFRRSAKSRTFTNFSFQGATQAVAEAEQVAEEANGEAKESKAEPEEAPKKRGKKKGAEAGGAQTAEANGVESGAGPSGGQEERSEPAAAPGIAVLVKAPLRPVVEREEEDLNVKEYRKKEDEENVFTLGNRDRTKDKGKQKVDAVPEPAAAAKGKGKKKGMTLSINEFITSDDPEPTLRPQQPHPGPFFNDPSRPFINAGTWRGPPHGAPAYGPPPVEQRQPQEDFPELHGGPGKPATTPSAFGLQERPKDPFTLALDSIRIRDTEPTRHLVLEEVEPRAEDEDIRELLWNYGVVEEMTRVRGRELAFVTMRTVEEAATVRMLLANRSLKNRKIKIDSVSMHPSPSFFANYQPQWAAHDLVVPRSTRPSPSAAPFFPNGAGPSHQSSDHSEQWEEFEWSATGEDAFAASAASDWGSDAPAGNYGGSLGSAVLRTAPPKGKMKPDAPEFVPKSVLLRQTSETAAAQVPPKSESPLKPSTSGVSEAGSSGAGPSTSAAGEENGVKTEEASKRPVSAPKDGRETSAASERVAAERPVTAPKDGRETSAVKEEKVAERPASAPQVLRDAVGKAGSDNERPTSASNTAPDTSKSLLKAESRPATAPKVGTVPAGLNGSSTETVTRGASLSKLESLRDSLAAGLKIDPAKEASGVKLESARGLLGSGVNKVEPGRALVASGSGRLESMRDLLGSGDGSRPRSTSPVIPMPPALLAVHAGLLPMLSRPCSYAMGQVIATTTETLALYQDSIRLDKGYFVPGCQIVPHACALFLFNIDTLELHGFYEATSGSYAQCQDPYSGVMYSVLQPHIAFRRVRRCPAPLGRPELEPILPPGWWNADTWLLPLVLPAVQTEMLLILFGEKADYEERKKRGFAEELEGQLESAQAAAGPVAPPLASGIPLPTPAKVALAAKPPEEKAPAVVAETLLPTAAVPAIIAAAARGAPEASKIANGEKGTDAANGKMVASGEASVGKSGPENGTTKPAAAGLGVGHSGAVTPKPVASTSGKATTENRLASAEPSAAKPEANGHVGTPPKAAPPRPSSSGAAKEQPKSPSTPLSPQPSPSPLSESGAPADISSILAEITSAASGWGDPLAGTAAGGPPSQKSAPGTPPSRSSRPAEEQVSTPPGREGMRPTSGTGEGRAVETRSASVSGEGSGPGAAEAAAPTNMQSILDMLLPKAAAPVAVPPPVVSAPNPPTVARPYRPPVKYNPLGQAPLQAPPPNGRVATPPARESPPLVDQRTACKLCWVRKADFFIKECGHMGPCLSCYEDPRVDSSHCPQCRRTIPTGDPTKFIRMFR